jgi:hypothetical protein
MRKGVVALVGAAALVCGASAAATSSSGREAYLEADAEVVWVHQQVGTGRVLAARSGRIRISAVDGAPDRVRVSLDGGPRYTKGSVSIGAELLPGHARLELAGIGALLVVDGGEPGTDASGPPVVGGVAPTRDWAQLLSTSPSVTVRAFVLSGTIQVRRGG